jgi:hypothetical protein
MTNFLVNTCGGSLDEVANNVYNMRRNLLINSGPRPAKTSISIYMSRNFWFSCMDDIRGQVDTSKSVFYQSYAKGNQSLLGHPVYVVYEGSHPDCVIYGRVIDTNSNPPVSDLKKW